MTSAVVTPGSMRNAVRAVIVRDGRLLVLHKRSPHYGERYALPGGAQELGELLHEALLRECREEIGVEAEIIDLLYIADHFKHRPETPDEPRQQVEFIFACRVPASYLGESGPNPDKHQIAVRWVPLTELVGSPFYPPDLGAKLSEIKGGGDQGAAVPSTRARYLGLVK